LCCQGEYNNVIVCVLQKKNERKKKEKKIGTGTTGYQVTLIKKWVTWQLMIGVC